MSGFKHLRVEETPTQTVITGRIETTVAAAVVPPAQPTQPIDWRKLAVQNGERIAMLENQAKDLRAAADDARARFGKYKGRLDSSSARVNELQVLVTQLSAENADLRSQLADQVVLARKVHEFRQSILEGPLWDLFVEVAVVSPQDAGARVGQS